MYCTGDSVCSLLCSSTVFVACFDEKPAPALTSDTSPPIFYLVYKDYHRSHQSGLGWTFPS